MTVAPTLQGKNIRLRPHRMSDTAPFWAFFQTSRAEYVSKPDNETHFWYAFASEVGSWALTGMGGWAIETADGTLAGQVAVIHPPHFPETEIGWILFDGHEGQGIAFEAAQLALDYTWSTIQPASLVSYIDHRNTRSIALAERLGATRDDAAEKYDDVDVVYRHRRPQ